MVERSGMRSTSCPFASVQAFALCVWMTISSSNCSALVTVLVAVEAIATVTPLGTVEIGHEPLSLADHITWMVPSTAIPALCNS